MLRRFFPPGATSRRRLSVTRHNRQPEHLQKCAECQADIRRERQYIERLRGAAVPEASQDLAARLIHHTERLAGESQPVREISRDPAGLSRGLRIAAVAAGTLAVSAGALAVAAYVVAGDKEPLLLAGTAGSTALTGTWNVGPVWTSEAAFQPGSTITLDSTQLAALRDQGWACPELTEMGFTVVSAHASMKEGHPAVELNLESNGHYATITEEHRPAGAAPSSARLSITNGTPWQAVYAMPDATITYASDLPPDSADDAVPEIVRAGETMANTPSADGTEAWYGRLLRGLQTLLRPAGL
ncbi:hypothetical protein [Paenarthrobacter ilicis]|uniref:hypothetical protein n=1 Tax=Paenarthrobacter ilicis TaxID=43665 RepID=UPI0028D7FB68|nr:hypothetical protein [Paenarthrobacter ilicis]